MLAHDVFVVVLAQHQDVGKRTQILPHFVEGNARLQSPAGPHVRTITGSPQLDGALGNTELRIDFKCARVYRHRSGLLSRSAMTIDDRRANASSAKLVSKHQSRWACSNDKNIDSHLNLLQMLGGPCRLCRAPVFTEMICCQAYPARVAVAISFVNSREFFFRTLN